MSQVSEKSGLGLPVGHSRVELELSCRPALALQLDLAGTSVTSVTSGRGSFQDPRQMGLLPGLQTSGSRAKSTEGQPAFGAAQIQGWGISFSLSFTSSGLGSNSTSQPPTSVLRVLQQHLVCEWLPICCFCEGRRAGSFLFCHLDDVTHNLFKK